MTTVRPATSIDAPQVGEVHAEAWRVAYRELFEEEFLRTAMEARRQMWTENWGAFECDDSILLVADYDGRVVGFLHCGWAQEASSEQEVYGFYVHPTFWGQGIAPLVMSEALEQLRDRSEGQVSLWTPRGAIRARRFYEKTGWTASGRSRLHDFGDGAPSPLTQYVRETDR